jgi:hypothetical protein
VFHILYPELINAEGRKPKDGALHNSEVVLTAYGRVDLPQVSLEWVLITDLIINWIYPIKTHSR